MTKQQIANIVLWLAYGLALAASLNHVAWAFSTLEFENQRWAGWLAAIAVDAGLAALAYAIQQRRRAHRPTRMLWLGVASFAIISAFANLLHALTVEASGATVILSTFGQMDVLALAKAIVLSATLPLLVVYLGEVVSSDDAEASRLAEAERQRAERKAARVQPDQATVQINHNAPSNPTLPALPEPSNQPSNTRPPAVLDAINSSKLASKEQALDALLGFLAEHPAASLSAAGRAIGRSKSTVDNYVDELETTGRLKKNGNGWEIME